MSDLTRQQLCAELAISESTVRRFELEGLPYTPVGRRGKRYDLAEVKAWLRNHQRQPEPRPALDLSAMAMVFARFPVVEPSPPKPAPDRPALVRFHANKRRAAKLRRTPPWSDLDAMRAIYAEAQRLTRETGIAHHVDHVIPLQAELVSGLHVPGNLQILTGSDNSKKRNRYEP